MKTITLSIPDSINLDSQDALLAIASYLYGSGKLSLGQAAELANISKGGFMEILGNYNVSVFNYSQEELDSDLESIKNYNS